MVKKGNPKHITSLASAAGKTVSVESGTTNRDFLAQQSAKLVKAGKQAINVKTFPKDTDAAAALKAGRVDAYFGDSPVAVYYVSKDKSLAVGGAPIAPIADRRRDSQGRRPDRCDEEGDQRAVCERHDEEDRGEMEDDARGSAAEVREQDMLAVVDWHLVWVRIAHPDHVFFRALYTTVYMAVIAQAMGVVLGLLAALARTSKLAPLRWLSGSTSGSFAARRCSCRSSSSTTPRTSCSASR